ncbi:MAG: glycosyltransferase [Cyanobacteria bacterium P01_B01_bin.77]
MKILIVGDWKYPMYEKTFSDALVSLGHNVIAFSWVPYFSSIFGRAETKFCLTGIKTIQFNRELLEYVKEQLPDVVLIWRGINVIPDTLKKIKLAGVRHLSSYNHDDFTGPTVGAPVPWHHRRLWRLFLRCAPLYDSHFVKRQSNIEHLHQLGAKQVFTMPMWFVPELHTPAQFDQADAKRYETDIVFVGHYEPDGREQSIRALMSSGLKVKLWGGRYWTRAVLGDLYDDLAPVVPAEGEKYAKALCGAKICLCFLSKMNRDTYTRRCFEIPACGRLMLAERTDDLMRFFKEDEEACFFSSDEELVRKAKWLLDNPNIRKSIAQAGLRRVWADGHDVKSRASSFIETVKAK